jgi:hypothetical protein
MTTTSISSLSPIGMNSSTLSSDNSNSIRMCSFCDCDCVCVCNNRL